MTQSIAVVEPADAGESLAVPAAANSLPRPRGNVRWTVCALLFFATTINYMDRQVIGILKPEMQAKLGWSEIDYANIVLAFQLAYAGGQLFAGRMIDLLGVRVGYAAAVFGWSLAAMGHGLARSVFGFQLARGALGVTEGGNFPAAIKAVSEWFPRRERALATGIFNAGSNVGAMITPLLVPFIALRWGWEMAFVATGAVGLVWLVAWLALYERPDKHRWLSAAERDYIRQDDVPDESGAAKGAPRPGFLSLVLRRPTIAYVVAGMITGPVWWFYLFWGADFLHKRFGLDLMKSGVALAVVYLLADVGSVGGGWISSHLIKRGWTTNAARKTALLLCGSMVLPVFFATQTDHVWVGVLLLGVAAAAHQGWSANLYTFVSDTTPKQSVSTVVGIGGFAGGLAGMAVAWAVGRVLQATGSYTSLFAVASVMYLVGFSVLQICVPRIAEPRSREVEN